MASSRTPRLSPRPSLPERAAETIAGSAGGEGPEVRIRIERTWDGMPVGPDEAVELALGLADGALRIDVDAPFHDDPPPPGPAGTTERLWEYEVVELFLLGDEERYLEVELGPHGHHLVLLLRGARRVEAHGLPLEYRTGIRAGRWSGTASVQERILPPGIRRGNAYAVHGRGTRRRYLAWSPVPGPAPDFHRIERFGPLDPDLAGPPPTDP